MFGHFLTIPTIAQKFMQNKLFVGLESWQRPCTNTPVMIKYAHVLLTLLQVTFMRAFATFVSGLLLSALFLLAPSVHAAELQPFFTLKTSSINTLVSVAEKFGSMAGAADTDEFREFVNTVKNIRGVNPDGSIGFAAAVDDGGGINMLLLLPITDLWRAEVPGFPDIFDSIRPFLVRRGEGKFDINSPLGTYVAVQNQGYLVITPEGAADQVPADPTKLFADLEKVEFETLEASIFGPILLMAMMSNPDAGEQLETMVETYRELYKEVAVCSSGIAVNPQTADIEVSTTLVARKGSDFAKTFAGYKKQPTIFSGFRGTPDNTVFSLGDSASQPPLEKNALQELGKQQWETILEGFREQIEMEDETGELSGLAEAATESIIKIIDTESKRGASDSAFSLNTEGTLLFAFDTGSLAEIQKLAALATDFISKKIEGEAKALVENNLKLDYATVEGFKVSNIKIPVIATLELVFGPAPDDTLSDLTLGVFWATKEGNKQAIAVAAGLDFAKTEQAFRAALTQTRTAVPVQRPEGTFSIAGLGKFLQQAVYPIAEKAVTSSDQSAEQGLVIFKKVTEIFSSAGNDATATFGADIHADRTDMTCRVSGKLIQAIISAVRLGIEESNEARSATLRPAIRDF